MELQSWWFKGSGISGTCISFITNYFVFNINEFDKWHVLISLQILLYYQIQEFEESISEISEVGSSNSLCALDVQEKKLQGQNSSEISDNVC